MAGEDNGTAGRETGAAGVSNCVCKFNKLAIFSKNTLVIGLNSLLTLRMDEQHVLSRSFQDILG